MEKSEILNDIFSKTASGIKLGLERMSAAAQELGNPQKSYKVIHVAGTNGKGSVCTFMEAALRAKGIKTGLYTSPHLIDFKERFKVGGETVLDDQWLSVYKNIKAVCDKYELTFFEISTLIAFELFKNLKVEYAIVETGLGGRLDATNIVDPEMSIITKIGIDHTAYLGDSIISIAGEKLGIVKDKKPVVMQKPQEIGIIKLAENIAKEKGSLITFVEEPNEKMKLSMCGDFQMVNVNLVLRALNILNISADENVIGALEQAQLPGRFDIRNVNGRQFLFDVSHNPQAVEEFSKNIRNKFSSNDIVIIAGVMKDKDTKLIINRYSNISDHLIFTKPSTDRSEDPNTLASFISNNEKTVAVTPNVKAAIEEAFNFDKTICVTGSFFTVGEAMEYLGVSL